MSKAAMVALYARVSSEQQNKRGTIDSQIGALKERISADGAQIVEDMCFVDAGVSGATLIRPQLERLRDCAALGAIDQLYILSPDRLARKYAHQALLMEEFSACGVQVVFLNHAIGTTPEESLLLQIFPYPAIFVSRSVRLLVSFCPVRNCRRSLPTPA